MKFKFKHRKTGRVLYETEAPNLFHAIGMAAVDEVNFADVDFNKMGLEIPVIKDLDRKILTALKNKTYDLDMSWWHTCKTTHCRAGLAVCIAGEEGRRLEENIGTPAAAALIYAHAYPDLPIPSFYASNDEAMKDIKARAALAK